jgi:TPR repeat protein
MDQTKCIELLRESADLGFPPAQYQLGKFHRHSEMGLEQNEEEGLKYYEKAAEGGDLDARHNLGCLEGQNGDVVAAMRHWRLAASGGYRMSMDGLITYFEDGSLHHGDLAEAIRAFYRSRAEMKSEGRDQFIKHLKMTGKYKEEYDL